MQNCEIHESFAVYGSHYYSTTISLFPMYSSIFTVTKYEAKNTVKFQYFKLSKCSFIYHKIGKTAINISS